MIYKYGMEKQDGSKYCNSIKPFFELLTEKRQEN
jgi:hypothetical protein